MSVEALTRRDIIDILIGDDEVEAEYGIEQLLAFLVGDSHYILHIELGDLACIVFVSVIDVCD